jgi:uncharacterized membrane protein YfcA
MTRWDDLIPMVLVGIVAGTIGGMFGIGGGLIMVPALILMFGYDQRTAAGTSLLAQLLPVGLLGVAEYWQRHEVKLHHGLCMAIGLVVGAWVGAWLNGLVPREQAKQLYGIFLVLVGVYFLLAPGTPERKRAEPPRPAAAANAMTDHAPPAPRDASA